MKKRIISVLILLALFIPMLPFYGSIGGVSAAISREEFIAQINDASGLLFKGYNEQSRKYLADRLERAKSVLYSNLSVSEDYIKASQELSFAIDNLSSMYALEEIEVNGFDSWTQEELSAMNESIGKLSFTKDEVNSLSVIGNENGAVITNGNGNSIIGENPFGTDIIKADGIKFYISIDKPLVLDVSIGERGENNYTFTANGVFVAESGLVYIPFDLFSSENGSELFKNNLNYIKIAAENNVSFAVSQFAVYNEILEGNTTVKYTETNVKNRGDIEELAYYKIIDAQSGKAVSLRSSGTDLRLENTSLELALEESIDGENAQLFQLAPSPSGNGSFRIISKAFSNALSLDENANLKMRGVNLDDASQEWSFSAIKGEFTIQIRGLGKLTTAGNTVKATAANTFKKFKLYKVTEKEYKEFWSDEFDGTELDRSKWFVDDGFYAGGGIASLHYDDEDLLEIKDGKMLLTAKVERSDGWEARGIYMSSAGKFALSYGKVEIRAKLAYGKGQFPAFWLMPTDLMNMGASEIDIMEVNCSSEISDLGRQIGTIHWTTDDGYMHQSKVNHMPIYGHSEGKLLSDDYHTYGVEMDRHQVRYYFDGIQYMSLNIDTTGKEFAFGDMARYIIINNSLQGKNNATINYDFGMLDEYVTEVDYVKCFLESGEMTSEIDDYTADGNTIYSAGIDAIASYNFFELSFPMDVSPDGTQGAAADHGGKIYIFDPNTNVTTKMISMHPIERPYRVVYSPDGTKLAVATNQGYILIYDTSDYDKAPMLIRNGAVIQESVLFTKDSKNLVVGGFNGGSQAYTGNTEKWHFRVFDVDSGAKLQDIDVGGDPRDIVISDDGSMIAVSTGANGVFIFNTHDWSEYAHFSEGHEYVIRGSDFSADGKLLVTSDESGVINVWDVEAKTLYKRMNNVNTSSVKRVVISPDCKKILASSGYGAARLFDIESGELISLLGGFEGIIREIAYSPNGEYIVVSSYDGTTKLFAADGTYLNTLGVNDSYDTGFIISDISFTPDSKYVMLAMRNLPNFIQKWAIPQQVDKTALDEAILNADPDAHGLEFAKEVSKLKYATVDTVYKAYSNLVTSAVDSSPELTVSTDGQSFDKEANVFRGGYLYVKGTVPPRSGKLTVSLIGRVLDVIENIEIDENNLLDVTVSDNYDSVTYYLKLKMNTPGSYNVTLTDGKNSYSSAVVNVDAKLTTTDDFLYSINDNEVTIEAGVSGERLVEIPEYIEGYPVTKIAPFAFMNYGRCIDHMKVILPSTIKEIGKYAFHGCNSLRRIELPEGLEVLDSYAFNDSRTLGRIELPSTLKRVGDYAISKTALGTLIFNSDLRLSSTCFNSIYRIREVIFAEGIETITGSLYAQYLLEAVYVPESVTSISSSLFYSNENIVKLYGIPGSYAETFAANNPTKYTFVPLAAPVISGVSNGKEYDLYLEGEVKAEWDAGHIAYLNGAEYKKGTPITTPGEYTLKVINGYDEYSTEITFTVVDTTPPPYKLGEMDGDGEITVADALAILRIVARLAEPIGNQALAADCDLDGEITVADALAVLRYVAKLTDTIGN